MKRINAKLIISWSKFQPQGHVDRVTDEIIKSLSKKYGGLTLTQVRGVWCEDAETSKDEYLEIQYEDGLQFDISCEPQVFKIADIHNSFVPAMRINAKWVHFEISESKAYHFDVTTINRISEKA